MKEKIKAAYKKYKALIYIILGIIAFILLWWLLSLTLKTSLLPSPLKVIVSLGPLLADSYTYISIGWTLLRLFTSVVVGFVLGSILGIFGALNKAFYNFMRPFIIVLRTLPTATIIYLIIALSRTVIAPFIIVFLIVFPLCYEALISGIKSIDENIIMALKIDGTKTIRAIYRIYLPLAWPNLILGLVSSLGLGMKVCIMAEILSGDNIPGLGRMIYLYYMNVDMDNILAISLIAIILIGLTDIAIHYAKKLLQKYTTKNG